MKIWSSAKEAAIDFWNSVSQSKLVSRGFRLIAEKNLNNVRAL